MQTNPNAISVLIRTFNSEKTLARVFSGLKLLADEEYIIVDSGSTDSTLSIAADHGAVIVHALPPFSYSKSLNLGFQAARQPWVLVLSSHSLSVVPDLLGIFRGTARDLPADIAVAYGINTLDGRGPYDDDKIRYYTEKDYQGIEIYCGNGNALYCRSAWEQIPFDETVRTAEDKIWMAQAFKKGYRIGLVSDARTVNRTHYSLRYMFRKGASDSRAADRPPVSVLNFVRAIGSHTRRFFRGNIPVGTWVRYFAHICGQFVGSYQKQNNVPGK